MNAEQILQRLRDGGRIVSTSRLSVQSIELARAADRMWVDADGFGYVYEPPICREHGSSMPCSFCAKGERYIYP